NLEIVQYSSRLFLKLRYGCCPYKEGCCFRSLNCCGDRMVPRRLEDHIGFSKELSHIMLILNN
ncbi:hypothetical protein L9F63_006109, partial [Diploptera punctata]